MAYLASPHLLLLPSLLCRRNCFVLLPSDSCSPSQYQLPLRSAQPVPCRFEPDVRFRGIFLRGRRRWGRLRRRPIRWLRRVGGLGGGRRASVPTGTSPIWETMAVLRPERTENDRLGLIQRYEEVVFNFAVYIYSVLSFWHSQSSCVFKCWYLSFYLVLRPL